MLSFRTADPTYFLSKTRFFFSPKLMKAICFVCALFIVLTLFTSTVLAQINPSAISGKRVKRIVIRNAMVVDGSGKPAAGPFDIVVENDIITQITGFDPISAMAGKANRPAKGDVEIDAAGKYVLPGLIDLHAHIHDERAGVPMPVEYCMKMWLASGITTIREAWSNKKMLAWRDQTASNHLAGPRIFAYGGYFDAPTPTTAEQARRIIAVGVQLDARERFQREREPDREIVAPRTIVAEAARQRAGPTAEVVRERVEVLLQRAIARLEMLRRTEAPVLVQPKIKTPGDEVVREIRAEARVG